MFNEFSFVMAEHSTFEVTLLVVFVIIGLLIGFSIFQIFGSGVVLILPFLLYSSTAPVPREFGFNVENNIFNNEINNECELEKSGLINGYDNGPLWPQTQTQTQTSHPSALNDTVFYFNLFRTGIRAKRRHKRQQSSVAAPSLSKGDGDSDADSENSNDNENPYANTEQAKAIREQRAQKAHYRKKSSAAPPKDIFHHLLIMNHELDDVDHK